MRILMPIGQLLLSPGVAHSSKVSFGRILLGALLVLPAACAPVETDNGTGDLGVATGGIGGVTGTGGTSGGGPSTGGGTGGDVAAGGSAGFGTGGAGSGSAGTGGNAGSGGGGTGGGGGSGGAGTGGDGGGDAGTSGSGGAGTGGDGGSSETCPLPTSFSWTSSGPLAEPQSPAGHNFVSLKDFTIVRVDDEYAIYATAFDATTSWTGV